MNADNKAAIAVVVVLGLLILAGNAHSPAGPAPEIVATEQATKDWIKEQDDYNLREARDCLAKDVGHRNRKCFNLPFSVLVSPALSPAEQAALQSMQATTLEAVTEARARAAADEAAIASLPRSTYDPNAYSIKSRLDAIEYKQQQQQREMDHKESQERIDALSFKH